MVPFEQPSELEKPKTESEINKPPLQTQKTLGTHAKAINDYYEMRYGSRLEHVDRAIRSLSEKQFETVQKKPLPHTFRSLGVLWLNQMLIYSYFDSLADQDP